MVSGPQCESLREEMSGVWALDWSIVFEKNWLILGRTVPPGSGRPQMAKLQNTENRRPGL